MLGLSMFLSSGRDPRLLVQSPRARYFAGPLCHRRSSLGELVLESDHDVRLFFCLFGFSDSFEGFNARKGESHASRFLVDGLNWATQDGDRNEAQDALLPLALDVATIWVRRQPTVRAARPPSALREKEPVARN